jgi:hypothetical protein
VIGSRGRDLGNHGDDPFRRGELGGVDHHEKLDQVFVEWRCRGLHDEDVRSPHRFLVATRSLPVLELFHVDVAELDLEALRYPHCKTG